ncbi:MAG TPA: cell division inhibitor [Flavobacteriales bacterium]|jgi:ligand-binding SRPBCC domain-containing protein|nr:SRPBCC family protein [Flavobacteriales bacterium]HAW20098.1 cell division inhibitor [Flavobacteriales bacterium]
MKIYQLRQEQHLPISLDHAWDFFSSPENLEQLTPEDMKFKILSDVAGVKAYPGQIINYKINLFPLIWIRWTTEICQCVHEKYFADEQRFGPYSFWHHKHFFERDGNGVKMVDVVDYALPLGVLGRLAHAVFVKQKLKSIFDYRREMLIDRFRSIG